ncbi:MAG TPA: WYL domain-containing protein [Gemmatimonadaceae bacterium]|nr:WYL domain-containing protein [Gemmatimonadaceae bacterium]
MTDTATARLRRLLLLLPAIADGKEHAIDGVARRLSVTRDVLLADLRALSTRLEPEGGYIDSVSFTFDGAKLTARTNPFRRPMRLTLSELCALELGLAVLRQESAAEEHPVIDRARVRLRRMIAQVPGGAVPDGLPHASRGDIGNPEHFAAVQRALLRRRKLFIVYHGSGRERTERTICPYSLVASGGMFYVVAYCERSAALRIFRLDRMEEVRLLGDGFLIPDGFSLAQVLRDGKPFFTTVPAPSMTVRFSPRVARWIAEHEQGTAAADGSLTVEYPLADRAWAVRHVLQYGPDAEVLAPEDVREEIARRLRGMDGRTRKRRARPAKGRGARRARA